MTNLTEAQERERIFKAVAAAMPHCNPLLWQDWAEGHNVHMEPDDIIAVWKAAKADATTSAIPTMDDAIAAGDGTLHGAITYWQNRALAAEAARDVDDTNKVLADNYIRATTSAGSEALSDQHAACKLAHRWLEAHEWKRDGKYFVKIGHCETMGTDAVALIVGAALAARPVALATSEPEGHRQAIAGAQADAGTRYEITAATLSKAIGCKALSILSALDGNPTLNEQLDASQIAQVLASLLAASAQATQAVEPVAWIDVNDRLPDVAGIEDGETVLIANSCASYAAEWHGTGITGFSSTHGDQFVEVTHWMPIPAKPGTHPAPTTAQEAEPAMKRAYEAGWRTAANWMGRDGLIADIGSPAYERDCKDALSATTQEGGQAKGTER